jgi:predicted  nucleic acid-binding Zn-ribbon protein
MSDKDDNDNYEGILLEQIRDEIKAVHEAVGDIRLKVNNQPTRNEFNELKDDVRTIKASVTGQSAQIHDHDERITRLETDAA